MQQIQISKLFKLASGNGFKEELQGRESGDYGFYKVSDINGSTKYALSPVNFVSSHDAAQNRWNIIPQGSIVTAKIGAALSKNHRKILKQPSIIDNNMLAFIPNKKMLNQNYAYWLLKNVDMKDFENISTVPSINMSQLRQGKVTVLDAPIQQKIADFLDTETAQIDNLIAKQERLLELLEEKRRAIVVNAVTRGLDSHVELRETNIPWLGQIPAHWSLNSIKNLFKQTKSPVGRRSTDYKLLSLTLRGVIPRSEVEGGKNPENYDTYQIVQPGEIVACLFDYDVTPRTVGYVKETGMVTGAYTVLKSTSNDLAEYYTELLTSLDDTKELLHLCTGLRNGLSRQTFFSLKLPRPPVNEQKAILQAIRKNARMTAELKQKIQTQITLLRERRISLISHAVTGKVKV